MGGLFAQSDLMTLGLSAFFFDESDTVDAVTVELVFVMGTVEKF